MPVQCSRGHWLARWDMGQICGLPSYLRADKVIFDGTTVTANYSLTLNPSWTNGQGTANYFLACLYDPSSVLQAKDVIETSGTTVVVVSVGCCQLQPNFILGCWGAKFIAC